MTPWPTADVASYNHSPPTYSPMQQQQNHTDPFASYGAGPGMPQFNNNTQQQQQQQQPPPPQQQPPAQQAPVGNVDPWATMQAQPPAPTMQPPMQVQPPMMQTQQPPSQPPMQQQIQQAAIPQEQTTPPPAYVNATSGNQTPPSPLGDVSVLAAANNAAVAAAQAVATAPSMPTAANTNNMQPLQPVPQSMPMQMHNM